MGKIERSVGVDWNSNDTPGLLVEVDVAALPRKVLRTFMGEGWRSFERAIRA